MPNAFLLQLSFPKSLKCFTGESESGIQRLSGFLCSISPQIINIKIKIRLRKITEVITAWRPMGALIRSFYAISQFRGEFAELAWRMSAPGGRFLPSRHSAESTGPASPKPISSLSKFMSCFLREIPWRRLVRSLGLPSGRPPPDPQQAPQGSGGPARSQSQSPTLGPEAGHSVVSNSLVADHQPALPLVETGRLKTQMLMGPAYDLRREITPVWTLAKW